ncbi:hypothetical protein E4U21_005646 [Claviceps maximensis]|nr:hypothetical protein E4U21_005646 [Claviceps maximensis]
MMPLTSHMSQTRQLLVLAAGIAVLVFFINKLQIFFRHRRLARLHGCKPITNTPIKDPILGLDMVRKELRAAKAHKILEEGALRFKTHGNTFRSRQLLRDAILTIEPENIKTVLALNFNDYGIGHRLQLFSPLLGAGIFDTDGQHWRDSRALIRPNFTRDQVADLAAFERLIPDLFSLIPRDGKTTVDLQDLFFRYTIDSATDFLFGQSVGSLKDVAEAEISFAEAFNYAQDAIRMRAILGPFHIFRRDPKATKCNKLCRELAWQFVQQAVEAVQNPREGIDQPQDEKRAKYIFSHELARQTSDKVRILDELMNVLLAGRDTTASLLSNMFFMLAKDPAAWAKLQAEVAGLEGRQPTYEELRNLKYLKCCMNESLRIHPVVPFNSRQALKDTILPVGGGPDGKSPVFVPKGTRVGYSTYAMHRRPDLYGPDADEFRPERWETGKILPRWEYLPFNGGPRVCPGQQYALTEVSYVTVRIAQEFAGLESRDAGAWEENLTLTLCSRNGTKVCLVPRGR